MIAITLGPMLSHIDNWVSNRFLQKFLFIFTTRTACLLSLKCFRFLIFVHHRGQSSFTNFFKSSFVDCKEDSLFCSKSCCINLHHFVSFLFLKYEQIAYYRPSTDLLFKISLHLPHLHNEVSKYSLLLLT